MKETPTKLAKLPKSAELFIMLLKELLNIIPSTFAPMFSTVSGEITVDF